MNTIVETYVLSASNTDILKAPSRLAALPENGIVTVETSATVSNTGNHAELTVRTPDGDVPMRECRIPANGFQTGSDVLHGSTEWLITLPVRQGNHLVLELDVTGTVSVILRVTYQSGA